MSGVQMTVLSGVLPTGTLWVLLAPAIMAAHQVSGA